MFLLGQYITRTSALLPQQQLQQQQQEPNTNSLPNRPKPGASTVFVTGTFDDWKKTEQLNSENGVFTKRVKLPSATDLVHYKFVVDGDWVIDEAAPTDKDALGNTNNVLREADITPLSAGEHAVGAIAGGAAAVGAAAAAAGAAVAHHTKSGSADMPGAFPPETPIAGKSSPGMQFYPGDIVPDYSTYFSATSPDAPAPRESSLAEPSKEKEPTFSVNPLPPTSGLGNPAPGDVNTNTTTSAVALDRAAYEKADALPTDSSAEPSALDASKGAFGVPPVTNNLIPESSLPIGTDASASASATDNSPFIASSAGTATSTAALAGQVPLEPRGVPEVVKESQDAAHASPEASASPDAVQNKDKLEQELQKKVPEEPATSEDTTINKLGVAAAGAGGIMAATAAAFGFTSGSQSAATQKEIADQEQGDVLPATQESSDGVPAAVSESQHQAHVSPEASANPEAVTEKSAVEKELTSKVPVHNETGEPAPTSTAATSAVAPGSGDPVIADASTAPAIAVANGAAATSTGKATEPLPSSAAHSGQTSAVAGGAVATGAAAGTSTGGVDAFKSDPVRAEGALGKATGAAQSTIKNVTQNATQASVKAFQNDPIAAATKPAASRDVSPHTRGNGTSAAAGATSSTVTDATAGKDDKKKNRRSFFGRIKDKIKEKS